MTPSMKAQWAKYVRDMGLKRSSTAEPEQMAQQLRIKWEDMKQEQTGDNYKGKGPEAETNTLTIDSTFKEKCKYSIDQTNTDI